MIQKPAIDNLVKKTNSKYGLCVVCSKRAREILDHSIAINEDTLGKDKPLTVAAKEIANDNITITKD